MYDSLKNYCQSFIPLTNAEVDLIDDFFEIKELKKKEFLLQDGKICNFIAFIAEGSIRHFHIKNGVEKTCDISFEDSWVTDFQSFTHNTACIMNLQAMEPATVFFIRKENLLNLYKACNKYETFGRPKTIKYACNDQPITSSTMAEATTNMPILDLKIFKSIRMRTITGSAVMAIAVPMKSAKINRSCPSAMPKKLGK